MRMRTSGRSRGLATSRDTIVFFLASRFSDLHTRPETQRDAMIPPDCLPLVTFAFRFRIDLANPKPLQRCPMAKILDKNGRESLAGKRYEN